MKFIVRPQRNRGPLPCKLMTTMCALCSEDSRFCDMVE